MMGALAGLLGMLVAVPALATVIVLVRHVVIFYTYGEHPTGAEPHAVLRPSRASGQHAIPA
jgi:predicted PurR-regulated permease PerM